MVLFSNKPTLIKTQDYIYIDSMFIYLLFNFVLDEVLVMFIFYLLIICISTECGYLCSYSTIDHISVLYPLFMLILPLEFLYMVISQIRIWIRNYFQKKAICIMLLLKWNEREDTFSSIECINCKYIMETILHVKKNFVFLKGGES